ncbi:MAG TPA: serine/threonine-protein kinase [Polyangiales bacterium]|nr:serine/threonine-protein kinase [Polyangiales bacterium]
MNLAFDPHIGRVLAGHYRVDALLGRGGMGAVYRGLQLSVGRPVAIKLISSGLPDPAQSLQRFRREAEATGRLNHPNTIRLFDFGLTEYGEVYMVMELLEGCDLASRLQHGPLPPAQAFHIMRQILSALSETHARGIVHRDLKPGNVFLSNLHGDPNFVKLMDFGIAGMEQGKGAQKLTVTGAVMGTPAYMSPEQAQGKPVDARGDLYSCGVVLFEMLTGRTPFDADTLVSMLLAHVTQTPKRLVECGASFPELPQAQTLIDRLLAKAPSDRPPSAAYVLAEVEALQSGSPLLSETAALGSTELSLQRGATITSLGWDKPVGAPSARKIWIGAGAVAVAVAALSIGLILPPKAATPAIVVAPAPRKAPEPEPETTQSPIIATPQPAASGAHANAAARTHTDVDDPVALDGSVKHPTDTLADVPTAEVADDEEADEEPPARGKARSRSARAARRAARARSARRQSSKTNYESSGDSAAYSAPSAQSSVTYAPPAVASDESLRRAPPFPSIAAAKRAHDGGKISISAYDAAVNSLKARRLRRIAIEQQNLAQGKINAQEYEWRLGRIDQEYRGE